MDAPRSGELIQRAFGAHPTIGWHAGYVLTQTTYRTAWALFREDLERTVAHRFRTYEPASKGGDVVAHTLAQHVGIQLGLQRVNMGQEISWAQLKDGFKGPPPAGRNIT